VLFDVRGYHIGYGSISFGDDTFPRSSKTHTVPSSLTLHPNKRYVATGQIGKEPFIAVWDVKTMETVALLKGHHQRGLHTIHPTLVGSLVAHQAFVPWDLPTMASTWYQLVWMMITRLLCGIGKQVV
jgi:hypothetical protein